MSALSQDGKTNGLDVTADIELTQDEAELYDRQIRLWGIESQKRLRCARVLIVGMQGYGCEVAKNMILSGVKSVTLLDDAVLTEADTCAQFLAPRDKIGSNRASTSLTRAQQLNPMVRVSADSGSLADKTDSYFRGFDAVVVSALTQEQAELCRVDRLCRAAGVLFLCGDVAGAFGFLFLDLGKHHYEEQLAVLDKKGAGSRPVETRHKTTVFVPLEQALSAERPTDTNKRKKTPDHSYFLMRALLEFRCREGRTPAPGSRDADMALLRAAVPAAVPDAALQMVTAQLAPAAAVLGAVTAQELVKALSHKEEPHNNFFFFNPLQCSGIIETIG